MVAHRQRDLDRIALAQRGGVLARACGLLDLHQPRRQRGRLRDHVVSAVLTTAVLPHPRSVVHVSGSANVTCSRAVIGERAFERRERAPPASSGPIDDDCLGARTSDTKGERRPQDEHRQRQPRHGPSLQDYRRAYERAHGFCRVRCAGCERLVTFAFTSRAVCPSCRGLERRALATHCDCRAGVTRTHVGCTVGSVGFRLAPMRRMRCGW